MPVPIPDLDVRVRPCTCRRFPPQVSINNMPKSTWLSVDSIAVWQQARLLVVNEQQANTMGAVTYHPAGTVALIIDLPSNADAGLMAKGSAI